MRCDLVGGDRVERWYIAITDGAVEVSHRNARADAVMRVDKAVFDGMVTGQVNATAALLRGAVEPEGDVGLLLLLQRIFPGPQFPQQPEEEA